jgi:hypothetical protein
MKAREGENRESWFRCNRYYNLKGQWFFSTREGVDFGPFETQKEAAEALQAFIKKYQDFISQSS